MQAAQTKSRNQAHSSVPAYNLLIINEQPRRIIMTMTRTETLVTYVGDVHALVTHGLKAVERQVQNLNNVSHKQALPAVVEAERVLNQQKEALEARIQSLGGSTTAPIKDAVAAVAGIAAGLINAVRPSETVKSLRDDAAFFSSLGIAYLLLFTTAKGLDDMDTAMLAQAGYEGAARLVMHLDRILPSITVEELREENLDVKDVSDEVNAMVASAWDRAQPSAF
jgi:ferritin-like metal-binding protein YciE